MKKVLFFACALFAGMAVTSCRLRGAVCWKKCKTALFHH